MDKDLVETWEDRLRQAENEVKAARELIRSVTERARKNFAADDVFPRSLPTGMEDLLGKMERALDSAESRIAEVTDSIARHRRG